MPDWSDSVKEFVVVEIFRLCNIPFSQLIQPHTVLRLPCPVNLNNARMNALTNEYFVTHKYDGVRYLIVQATFGGRQYLIRMNRRCTVEILERSECSAHENAILYVLDCEQVQIGERNEYVCHDVFVFDSVPVLFRDFSRRLKYIYMLRNNTKGLPSCKSLFQCADLNMLVHKPQENLPMCDGYIFIHAASKFEAGTCESVLKWKDSKDISIDLLVDKDKNVFMCRMGSYVPFTHSVVQYELPLSLCVSKIVEFCYDGSAWFPALIRDDKSTANDAHVVSETIKSVRQPITLEALVSHCSRAA